MITITVPLTHIDDNPWQTRISYDEEHLTALSEDIRRNGIMQDPIGRLMASDGSPEDVDSLAAESSPTAAAGVLFEHGARVQLAFGHTRRRAAERAGLGAIDVVVKDMNDVEMATYAWTENSQRKDISAIEEARAIEHRKVSFGWTNAECAEHLGVAPATVSNKLRLLHLPEDIQASLDEGALTERQALALVPLYQLAEDDVALLRQAYGGYYAPERIAADTVQHGQSSEIIRDRVSRAKDLLKRTKDEAECDLDLDDASEECDSGPSREEVNANAEERQLERQEHRDRFMASAHLTMADIASHVSLAGSSRTITSALAAEIMRTWGDMGYLIAPHLGRLDLMMAEPQREWLVEHLESGPPYWIRDFDSDAFRRISSLMREDLEKLLLMTIMAADLCMLLWREDPASALEDFRKGLRMNDGDGGAPPASDSDLPPAEDVSVAVHEPAGDGSTADEPLRPLRRLRGLFGGQS